MPKIVLYRLTDALADGTYRVYVRLTHHHQKAKKKTNFTCTLKDTDKAGNVTSPALISKIYETFLADWEERLKDLTESGEAETMSALEILTYLDRTKNSKAPELSRIDFIAFAREHEQKARRDGRRKSAIAYLTVINSLIDYTGKERLFVDELTTSIVGGYIEHLRSPHKVTRLNHGKKVTMVREGLSNQSINNRIKDFKTLFNAMKRRYSDPLTGEEYIRTNPFKFWKPLVVRNAGGYRATDATTIRLLNGLNDLTPIEDFARDMFILSFCLMGINATDLYDLGVKDYRNGRIGYCRNKTKNRRSDEAYISVEVPPQALPILKKHLPRKPVSLLNLSERYSTVDNLSRAINKGLKRLYERNIGIPHLTYYSARHTWATIARNDCGISREDIDMALNHTNENLAMADKYIRKDFAVNDRNNRMVMDFVFGVN